MSAPKMGFDQLHRLTATTRTIVVMGVSGCGKSTVAQGLVNELGSRKNHEAIDWVYADADSFHPAENVEKMRNGLALNDEDRAPWLAALNQFLLQRDQAGSGTVLACSALKQRYRQRLSEHLPNIVFVHLHGSFELIAARMAARPNHYMPPSLLLSQFEALETPTDAVTIDIQQTIPVIIAALANEIS